MLTITVTFRSADGTLSTAVEYFPSSFTLQDVRQALGIPQGLTLKIKGA
jgi:hypothetical protein